MGIETAQIGQIAQGIGAGVSTYGAYANSKATQTAYNMQARVNANNATVAGWQADDALARGDRAAIQSRLKTKQFKGTQRAALAANGVDLGQGSALNILADTDYFGEIDAGTIKDNAAREAWAIRTQAQNYANDASLLKSRADAESPWLAAGISLLTSATKVASNWYPKARS